MNKPLYVLELRKHFNKRINGPHLPNAVCAVIGVFTSITKAEKWIRNEGQSYLGKSRPKHNFWALVEYPKTNESCGFLKQFYYLDGLAG